MKILGSILVLGIALGQIQTVIAPDLSEDALLDYIQTNYKTTRTLGYDKARDTMYAVIDIKPGNQLECVYTGFTITLNPAADPSTDAYNKGINCEHSWPQSLGADSEPQKSDLHHLYPVKDNVNSSRGNYPYQEIPDQNTDVWFRLNYSQTSIPTQWIDEYSEKENNAPACFEPRECHKGDAARSMLYFYAIYQSVANENFWLTQKETFRLWIRMDPVDMKEYERTWIIAGYQDNKPNPFVLDSTLARRIWWFEETTINPVSVPVSQVLLCSAYPNPFNAEVTFRINLPQAGHLQLTIYDLRGRVIDIPVESQMEAGEHHFAWQAADHASGVYLIRVESSRATKALKCILLR